MFKYKYTVFIYAIFPISKPQDMQGKNIRVLYSLKMCHYKQYMHLHVQ